MFRIHLDKFVWDKLNELQMGIGPTEFARRMSQVDPDIQNQLGDFMRPHANALTQ